ncbi:hypothetical protein QBC34DRAFT_76634 [Podospora aff. communis PSN243]|uniref:Heterokaryon incompatibility domain-containing protein n=1 Tax=Podospora aff. communis PSN243 TaxID=3040156 RepID=A0AAV9GRM0_9PEZI|nr:hypothetical protein QBC34DRAFT_76634 [Podospora aff. communis PSN243]
MTSAFSRDAKTKQASVVVQAMNGIYELFLLPYWHRMWTFQEYCLPAREPVCICGEQEVLATRLEAARTKLIRYMASGPLGLGHQRSTLGSLSNRPEAIRDVDEHSDWAKPVDPNENVLSPTTLRALESGHVATRLTLEPTAWELVNLVYLTLASGCLDPRDKVYALYGMVPKIRVLYPPDYDKPMRRVLHEAAAFMNTNETSPYYIFTLDDEAITHTSSVSWVPNFSQTDSTPGSIHDYFKDESARNSKLIDPVLGQNFPLPQVSQDLTTLSMVGWDLGPVDVTFRFGTDPMTVL